MPGRGEFLHWLVIEDRDGKQSVLSVYKDGGVYRLVSGSDFEHIVSRGRTIEREVGIVFHSGIVRVVMPADGYPSLD